MYLLNLTGYIKHLNPADYVIFLGLVTGLILYKKLYSTPVKVLVWLLLVTLFVELSTPLQFFSFRKNNYWLYNIFTPVECSFYALLYYMSVPKRRRKLFVLTCWIIALCVMLADLLFIHGLDSFILYGFVASCVAITLFAFTYLLQQYSAKESLQFYKNPIFWITIGVLAFYPPNIVSTTLITDMYKKDPQLAVFLYNINGILNIIMYSIYLIAIILDSRQKSHLHISNEQ